MKRQLVLSVILSLFATTGMAGALYATSPVIGRQGEHKALEESQQKDLAAWKQTVEQAQEAFNRAEAELEELPAFRRYVLAEARLNAAKNGLAAVIKGTCGELEIKPSECEISADGKTARRKEAQKQQ